MKEVATQLAEIELPAIPDLSIDQQRENTEHILDAAGGIARTLRPRIEEQAAGRPRSMAEAESFFEDVEEGESTTGYGGLSQPGLWLQETVWAIAQGRRTVVNLPGFYMVSYRENGADKIDDAISPYEALLCSIGGIMRAIRPPHSEMQINFPIDDHIDPATGRLFSEPTKLDFLAKTTRHIQAQGGILPEDRQGRDYNILSLERSVPFFEKMVLPHLRKSPWGSVMDDSFGRPQFYPHEELLDIAPEPLSDKSREEYLKHGIYLASSSIELSSTALMAASSAWNSDSRKAMRLNILRDTHRSMETNEQFMLFRALGMTQLERFHTLRIPSNALTFSEGKPQYALSRQIEKYATSFMESLDYDNFDSFDPVEYVMRNYGESILTDDKNLCMLTMFALDFLGIKNARAADIGCGPNLYPAMLLEPYSRTIDLLEYSPANRSFLGQWFAGTLPSEQQDLFDKFARLMEAGGGSQYRDVVPRLKDAHRTGRLDVTFGDSFNLPKNEWNLLTSSFVGDSIIWQKLLFPQTVRQMKNALTPEGVTFSVYMINDPKHRSYPAGEGKKFPNISQSATEIYKTYVDNGMTCVVIPTAGPEKFRDGYSGMAFVAAAHQGSQMAQKIKQLARPLHEFATAGYI